jgi:hypothetical protein
MMKKDEASNFAKKKLGGQRIWGSWPVRQILDVGRPSEKCASDGFH